MTLRILLPAGRIPLGSVVTKRTGEKEYVLSDKITVYVQENPPVTMQRQEVRVHDDCVFMVPGPNPGASNFGFNVVSKDTELMWHVDEDTLMHWLEENLSTTHEDRK